jgi:probable O-glycosylation ligase (exosortase A-associated)
MRDIAILLVIGVGLIGTLRFPYVGILLWTWITLMAPHQQAFGFSRFFPVNLIVAVVAILSLLASREKKSPPNSAMTLFTVLFLIWITLNSFIAVDPGWSWPWWDRVWRIIVLGLLVSITASNRTRIHALLLVMALSLLFYGVKGGLFTLVTGGNYHVMGQGSSMITDNNQLALAILMAIPLANYVRLHSAHFWIRYGLMASMVLSTIAVVGSYSRGAFLALGGLVVIAWLRAKQKWLYPLAAAVVIVPLLHFMPQSYFDRIDTIQNASADSSFTGRVTAWKVAWGYAVDHFPFGAGLSGPERPQVFSRYAPGLESHAAHSIYFEVLGDVGFAGLFLYLVILGLCFWYCFKIRQRTKRNPDWAWAYDLAGMMQLTLFVFCLGGSALSFAYYDVLFIAAGLLAAVKVMVERKLGAHNRSFVRGGSAMQAAAAPAE